MGISSRGFMYRLLILTLMTGDIMFLMMCVSPRMGPLDCVQL